MTRDLLPLLMPLLMALLLTGCVEVEERLVLEAEGSGAYELRLQWDADLLRRLNDVVGTRVASRFRRGALPLDAVSWRESVKDLPGLHAELIEIEDLAEGRRVLRVRVQFDRLEDLLGWEVFARRGLETGLRGDQARLRMTPLVQVPLLDRLQGALTLWRSAPERSAVGGVREPSPAERLGILPADGDLLAELLEARLAEARFTFRVEVPGVIRKAEGGEAVGRRATWSFGIQAVGKSAPGGVIDLTWSARAFDRVPLVRHPGR